ncbi:hypothetical protein [Zavarzinia compransoris]|uniref:Uncharacterized protein n=1 Tax=Zavarzinia compransoris TaxID=1264899 RepID=A0A317E650_9PROT|nr:hypothetical protein [Zavarzinia compransoris]PWR20863.1 hypothetical protein DKG75_12795 [Zavarzinia compransoris]TDP44301.1 hypothetical protein DES42_10766 [Zavarzinia compransoris]
MSGPGRAALLAAGGLVLLVAARALPDGAEAAAPFLSGAGPAAFPPVTQQLSAVLDRLGAPPSALALAAGLVLFRLVHPVAGAAALPGVALAVAAGPALALLCLLYILAVRGLVRETAATPAVLLMSIGGALGLMPMVHAGGAALALALLPALALGLPAPLIAGHSALGTAMVLGFPGLAAGLAYGLLAFVFGLSPLIPYATVLGFGPGAGAPGPALVAGLLLAGPALLWLAAAWGRRRGSSSDGARRTARVAGLAGLAPLVATLIHGLGGGGWHPALLAAPTLLAAALRPDPGAGEAERLWLALALAGPLVLAGLAAGLLPACLSVDGPSCWSP